jgi:ATP-dependent Clp protease, protease subunit
VSMTTFKSLLLLPLLVCLTSCKAQATVVHLNGVIDDDSAAAVVTQIRAATDPVILVLNSPGGSVMAGFNILQAMDEDGNVTAVVDGLCASMCSVVLADAPHRAMTIGSIVMLHQSAGTAEGHRDQVESTVQALTAVDRAMEAILGRAMNLTPEEIETHIHDGHEWWINAPEALGLHLVQKVIG